VDFVHTHRFPLLGELHAQSDAAYREQGLPLAILFLDDAQGMERTVYEATMAAAEDVADTHRGEVVFVWANSKDVGDALMRFNLSSTPRPSLVVSYMAEGAQQHYPLVDHKADSVVAISSHVEAVLAGQLSPLRRSTPVPEPPKGPGVVEVVGHTFQNQVMDSSKDVLVELYAPWCSHCKAFAPQYEKAAKALRFVPTIRVARFDATKNDPPVEHATQFTAEGYPSFRLSKASSNEVLQYEGERSMRAIIAWVQEHATHPFTFDPVEVNFLSSVGVLDGLTDSVRAVFKQNHELRAEVKKLKAQLVEARKRAELDIPTVAQAEAEVAQKKALGTEVRKQRATLRQADETRQAEDDQKYHEAELDSKKVEGEAERLIKAEAQPRHRQGGTKSQPAPEQPRSEL